MASGPIITLGVGFSSINGMEFESKGQNLHKCNRVFNVREVQKPGENFVIIGSILKSKSVGEAWKIRFEIDPETRRVIKSWCTCYVGYTGECKHCGALYNYINSERPAEKTDQEQEWTTPSWTEEEIFPKVETVAQMFGSKESSVRDVIKQKDHPELCRKLKADLERFGLTNSLLYKSLSVTPLSTLNEEDK